MQPADAAIIVIQQLSLAELIRFTSPLCNSDSANEEEFSCSAWVAIHSRWIIINVDAEAKCNCKSRKQKESNSMQELLRSTCWSTCCREQQHGETFTSIQAHCG